MLPNLTIIVSAYCCVRLMEMMSKELRVEIPSAAIPAGIDV